MSNSMISKHSKSAFDESESIRILEELLESTREIKTFFSGLLDGCGNEQQIDFELEVSNPPLANFNFTYNGCINDNAAFTDLTTSVKPTYKWWWNFDDPGSGASNVANVKNPTHTFSAPGTYNVRYANITTPGCLSDTITKVITLAPLPTATLSGNNIVCINSPSPNVTFTGTLGTLPNYIFTYNINGGATQTINSTTNTVSLPVPTATTVPTSLSLLSVSKFSISSFRIEIISSELIELTLFTSRSIFVLICSGVLSYSSHTHHCQPGE